MSNFLAVATVTAAIQQLLGQPAADDVPGATVSTDRPDTKKNQTAPQINVYLYHVTPNAFARDLDLPTRRSDGTLTQRPQAALDLHYLLTFYGDDKELEPQRLLGSAVRTLHTQSVLSRDLVTSVIAASNDNPPIHPSLVTTDLADALDVVRICPDPLELESLSKLWSVFFQTPYALSTAYTASVVFLENESVVTTGPPVVTPVLTVFPMPHPTVESVTVSGEAFAPITADRTVVLTGTQLRGDETAVRIGGVDLTPASVSATRLVVNLSSAPAGSLRAGMTAVQVVLARLVGQPPEPRGEVLSPVFPVQLHPKVVAVAHSAGVLTVTADVTIGARQRAAVQLLETTTGTVAAVREVGERTGDATSVQVSATGIAPDTYGVVLQLDGVSSPVALDGAGHVTSPTVNLP
jgi:hypothetical protein